MRLLLDTHAFLWFIDGSPQCSANARALIEDISNERLLSLASLWEMAIKVSLGKLSLAQSFETFVPQQLNLNRIQLLNVSFHHTAIVATLPFHHRDPFDRMVAAQALAEQIPIVSADSAFDAYGVTRVW